MVTIKSTYPVNRFPERKITTLLIISLSAGHTQNLHVHWATFGKVGMRFCLLIKKVIKKKESPLVYWPLWRIDSSARSTPNSICDCLPHHDHTYATMCQSKYWVVQIPEKVTKFKWAGLSSEVAQNQYRRITTLAGWNASLRQNETEKGFFTGLGRSLWENFCAPVWSAALSRTQDPRPPAQFFLSHIDLPPSK